MSDFLYYMLCLLLTVGVLLGIALMSRVKHAVKGNLISSLCVVSAIVLTLYHHHLLSDYALWICILIGFLSGLWGARKVLMIHMPQTVALLNGFGGAASALVAAISILEGQATGVFSLVTAGLALSVGTVTLTGSLVAGGKLHGLLPQKPVIWKKHSLLLSAGAFFTVASIPGIVIFPAAENAFPATVLLCLLFSAFYGVVFAIRVGGADMPITISLLNSLSGVAGAITGMAISSPLLITVGGIVGASGLLLTQIMCRAMNRPLRGIISGDSSKQPLREEKNDTPENITEDPRMEDKHHTTSLPSDPAELLTHAKKVIIVPGYGMALAQAQEQVRQLAEKLEEKGAEVLFGIHPVAGRMPGHMNVLLCEVNIPYDQLSALDDINPQFASCDVVVVIGANDVINPAANSAEGTPIYGMPVLDVEKAKHVIILNYDLKPGYAGVENPLYTKKDGVSLLIGDAKDTLSDLLYKIE